MLYVLCRRVCSAVECGTQDLDLGQILPVRRVGVPLSKALQVALLLSTQKQIGTIGGIFISHGAKLRVSDCLFPGVENYIQIDNSYGL